MKTVAQDEKQGATQSKKRANTAGQIIPRGEGTWLVRIFTGRDGNGKRRYLNKTIRGKKKDAQDYLSKTLTEISTGTFVEPSALSVNDYLDKWLESMRAGVRERTLSDYKSMLRLYMRPTLGGKRLADVSPLDLQSLYSGMLGRGLSPRTIQMVHTILFTALKQAVKWRMLARNPADAVDAPRRVRKEMRAFTPEEANAFLTAAASDRHSVMFAFALATGMRPSEYFGLKWSDIDFGQGTVTIRRSLHWREKKHDGWYFGETKTGRSRRTIPLPVSVVRALLEHKRKQAEMRLQLGPNYQNHELVFTTFRRGAAHAAGRCEAPL